MLRAQNINILTLGNPDGRGVFFPNGLNGVITKPTGYNVTDPGTESIDYKHTVASGQARRNLCHALGHYKQHDRTALPLGKLGFIF